MHLQFRKYRLADRDACINVFRSNVPLYFREHELNHYQQFIDSSGCPYFVVTSDAQVLGCGGFGVRPESEIADLCWGMVDASRHRKGIGEFLLIARVYRIITETDAKSIRLGTSQLTDGFFQRFGFATQDRTFGGIAEGLDDVQMHMELTDSIRDSVERRWKEING